MDFEELQDKKRLKKMAEPDDETAEDADLEAEEADENDRQNRDEETDENPEATNENLPSQEDLANGYKALEEKVGQLEQEAATYRRVLEQVGLSNRGLQRRADEENFIRSMRESFQKDPVGTVAQMLQRSEQELWAAVERRITDAQSEDRNFQQALARFLEEPKNAFLKPYSKHVEHLIREKGMRPNEVVELFRGIEGKRETDKRVRSAAAREVRNRSAVETGGEVGEPMDDVKEFDQLIKKAKTLDDMFKMLRKVKI